MVSMGRIFRRNFGNKRITEERARQFELADQFNKYEDASQEVYGTNYRNLTKSKRAKIRHKVYGDPNWKDA